MKGTEHQDAALTSGGNRETGSLKGSKRERAGDSVTSRRQQSSPKSSTMMHHLLCSVHADDGDGKPSGTTSKDGTYDSSQLGKRKLDDADVAGLVREASSGCGVVARGASSAKNTEDTDHHLSSEEEEEAEEAGLSLLFAASLMQQNDDAANDNDGDDVVAPIDTTTMALFDPVGTRHLHAASATPLTATATIPAFPQHTPGVTTSPVASLPASSSSAAATTMKPSTRPASSKPSTAFPVPPVSGACSSSGTITEPAENDVLCGRGGGINKHYGNIIYRRVVDHNKAVYKQVPKRHRMLVSQSIVQTILNYGGRFLQQQSSQNEWEEIPFRKAVQKTSQALREKNDDGSGDGDETSSVAAAAMEQVDSLISDGGVQPIPKPPSVPNSRRDASLKHHGSFSTKNEQRGRCNAS